MKTPFEGEEGQQKDQGREQPSDTAIRFKQTKQMFISVVGTKVVKMFLLCVKARILH